MQKAVITTGLDVYGVHTLSVHVLAEATDIPWFRSLARPLRIAVMTSEFNSGEGMKQKQRNELLLQALETEMGGVQIYTTAIECAVNEDLKKEWTEYLEQTQKHVEVVEGIFDALGLDKTEETPGRAVVRHIGESLVKAMVMALEAGDKKAAELVAAECVTLAETKDHLNWELIGEMGKKETGDTGKALRSAHEEVEEEEDEHLYHTTGWCRELWIQSLGLPAVLPPPEEEKSVKTAIGAARAKHARADML